MNKKNALEDVPSLVKAGEAEVTRRRVIGTGIGLAGAVWLGSVLLPENSTSSRTAGRTRSVLITGCSSGFGRLMAITFARQGWNTVASMRRLSSRNAPAARELRDLAAREQLALHVVEIDVDADASVNAGVLVALGHTGGRLDVLINNAAFSTPGPLEPQSPEVFEAQLQTNVLGPHRMMRAALPVMRRQRSGLVVNISSGTARVGFPGIGSYVASKWALEGLSATLRYELAPLGIEVCLVQAGMYATRWNTNQRAYWKAYLAGLSAQDHGRLGAYGDHLERYGLGSRPEEESGRDPQEVADAVLRLANMDSGSRPLRLAVGDRLTVTALDGFNFVSDQLERNVLGQSGFRDWLAVRRL